MTQQEEFLALVREAYIEGYNDASPYSFDKEQIEAWDESNAKKACDKYAPSPETGCGDPPACSLCEWDVQDGLWQPGCRLHIYDLSGFGPRQNGWEFCPYCGDPLVERPRPGTPGVYGA